MTASSVALVGTAVFALAATVAQIAPDTYLDLLSGRFVADHWLPHLDSLTLAGAGRRWIDQQWLADLLYYASWRVGGYALVVLLATLAMAGGFAVLTLLMVSGGVQPQRAALFSMAAVFMVLETQVQAQSFSYLFYPMLLWVLCVDSRVDRFSPRLGALLLPLLVVWSNLHGVALLGAGIAFAYALVRSARAAARSDRRSSLGYLFTALACPAALLATPYGLETIRYYRSVLGDHELTSVGGWRPLGVSQPLFWIFVVVAVVTVACVTFGLRHARPPNLVLLGTAALVGVLTTQSGRYLIWFVMAAIPLAAEAVSSPTGSRTRAPEPRRLAVLLAAALVLLLGVLGLRVVALVRASNASYEAESAPRAVLAATTRFLGCDPEATVLADQESADALLWLDPHSAGRVAYDGRLEIYPAAALAGWVDFIHGMDVRAALGRSDYELAVASSANGKLALALRNVRGWRILLADKAGIAVVRVDSNAPSCRHEGLGAAGRPGR